MTDKPDTPPPTPASGPARSVLSDSASANAPFLYFEDASAIGHLQGVIRITLEASRLLSTAENHLEIERVIVAHLRMNIPAAIALKKAIEAALLLATPPQSETKN